MTISLKDRGEFSWPAALEPKAYEKANKKKEIDALIEMLAIARKQFDAIGDFPFPPVKASISKAESWGAQALTFFKGGSFAKLVGSMKVIAKRSETLAKGKLSKEAAAAVKAVKSAAEGFIAEADEKKLLPVVNARMRDLVEKDKEVILKSLAAVFKTFKAAAKKGHPELKTAASALKNWSDDPVAQDKVRNDVNIALFDACRDMTQNLQNCTKALVYDRAATGISDRSAQTIPKLSATLIPYANSQSSMTASLDLAGLKSLITTIAAQAQLYDRIADDLP